MSNDRPDPKAAAAEAVSKYRDAGLVPIPGFVDARLVPVPILTRSRREAGWFVGVVRGEHILGFVQLGVDLSYRRSSTFGGEAPEAAEWLDANRATSRVSELIRPTERTGSAFLSFDRNPDRLGWIVPVESREGERRDLMVAGSSAFELGEEDAIG